MTAYILTWNGSPDVWDPGEYDAIVSATSSGGTRETSWRVGNRRAPLAAGDRVYLLRQNDLRGIVASGRLSTGEILFDQHWADEQRDAAYVRVTWDHMVPPGQRLPMSTLLKEVSEHKWNSIYSSGQALPSPADTEVKDLWQDHLSGGWTLTPGDRINRMDLSARYGGSRFGGIEPSARTPNVLVFTDPAQGGSFGYHFDGWTPDGNTFRYTGDGQVGPQRLNEGGNKSLAEHATRGRAVRLFAADGKIAGTGTKWQRYVGEFAVDPADPYTTEEAPDKDGNARTVLVFNLRPAGDVARDPRDSSTRETPPGPVPVVRPVPVTAAVPAEGSSDAVPLEAARTKTYLTTASTAKEATKTEAQLVDRFLKHLGPAGPGCIRYKILPPGETTPIYTDIYNPDTNTLYEAKGDATREAVRMAIGQLLDYSRRIDPKPVQSLLLPVRPRQDLLDLLGELGIGCVHEDGRKFVDAFTGSVVDGAASSRRPARRMATS